MRCSCQNIFDRSYYKNNYLVKISTLVTILPPNSSNSPNSASSITSLVPFPSLTVKVPTYDSCQNLKIIYITNICNDDPTTAATNDKNGNFCKCR